MSIKPEHIFLYDWNLEDTETDIEIKISYPQTFNSKIIDVQLLDQDGIRVSIPNEIPFVWGKLYEPVESMSKITNEEMLIITLVKKDPKEWQFLMRSEGQSLDKIDPKSAFIISMLIAEQQNASLVEYSEKLFQFSINANFPQALNTLATILMDKDTEQAIQYLIKATQMGDLKSTIDLAQIYASVPETMGTAFQMYLELGSKGIPLGISLAGQMLSPLSQIPFPQKDAEKAIELFQVVLEQMPLEPIACFEYAKLLNVGIGCEKDKKKAQELLAKARKSQADIPDLPDENNLDKFLGKEESKTSSAIKIGIIGSCIAGVVAFAYLAFNFIRKNRK